MIVAAAVNDPAVLANCLARSPDIASGALTLEVLEGFGSAARAYNSALVRAPSGSAVIFAHQDVYLPAGYARRLRARIAEIERADPNWAVIAPFGIAADGTIAGRVWSTAWNRVFEGSAALPAAIASADELLIVVRAGGELRFDDALPGFHLYATDIIQTALACRRRCYAIDAPVIHHDKPVIELGGSYRSAYRFMRRKWRGHLPIPTLIASLSRSPLPLLYRDARIRWHRRGTKARVAPTSDPAAIARDLGWEEADLYAAVRGAYQADPVPEPSS